MSCCGGGSDEALIAQKRQNEIIEAQLENDKDVYRATHRLLLLDAGESAEGATIIKQMKILHRNGFSDNERLEKVKYIKSNVQDVIMTVIDAMSKIDPPVTFASPESEARLQHIRDIISRTSNFDFPAEFFEEVEKLWSDAGVQTCFGRSIEYQLMDCAPYFMASHKLKEIAKEGYKPSDQDILRCRVLTSGIVETTFVVDRVHFHVIDVNGLQSERKKWIQCFNDVTAIFLVIDCSSFNMVIREDGRTNCLRESLELFESVWNNRWLRTVSFILFLNKQDFLRDKVDSGKKIEDYFPEFSSYRPPQEALERREADDSDTYVRAKYFFRDQFLRISQMSHDGRHFCFPLFTTAVDTENIRRVFDSCRDIIQRLHLQKYDLLGSRSERGLWQYH